VKSSRYDTQLCKHHRQSKPEGQMAIRLQNTHRRAVLDGLKQALRSITVSNGLYVDFDSMDHLFALDQRLPKQGQVRDDVNSIFGDDDPLYGFFRDRITRMLQATEKFRQGDEKRALIDFTAFADIDTVAAEMLEDFVALPRSYCITVPLPTNVAEMFLGQGMRMDFGASNSFRPIDDELRNALPLPKSNPGEISPFGAIFGLLSTGPTWPDKGMALQLNTNGFVDFYGVSKTVNEASDQLRAIFGVGLAIGLLAHSKTATPIGFMGARRHMHAHVHRRQADEYVFDTSVELDADLSESIANITMSPTAKREAKKFVFNMWERSFEDGKHPDRIRRSARWLFDSYVSENELLSFVQAMVSLEILLGEKQSSQNELRLTELLRNRCAYLIGASSLHREKILNEFEAIYNVRSRIVHGGHSRLTKRDRELFWRLRTMCGQAISREIWLLDEKTPLDRLIAELNA
jgi:hypothetical protein